MPHPSAQHPQVSRKLRRAQDAHARGDLDKAERFYNAALSVDAQSFEALHGLADIHFRRGRLDTALVLAQNALKSDLERAEGFSTLGLIFHTLRRCSEALISYDEGLRRDPDDPTLRNRRGVALLDLGRLREALAEFDRVLADDPQHLEALGNRGNTLVKLNRPAEALEAFDRALVDAPQNAQLLTNRAVALRRLDRPQEAVMSASKALLHDPHFIHARFVAAVARLTLGDFAAWRDYEARWAVGALASQRRKFAAPLWLGEAPIAGKTILLHAEQGFGDSIQFIRYAPLLAEQGAKVVVEIQPALVRLFATMPGITAVVARGQQLPPFDCHCPLLSLPLAFATDLATIPVQVPYAITAAADIDAWRSRLPARRPRIGLVWSGERSHDNDLNRSLRLETLRPLFELADVAFVSLQHEVRDEDAALLRAHPAILHIGESFRDFADTAAAISLLDGVISADTAVAHLAGALGKPLFLLLPFAADFRWLRERHDSPWYPTARLFRQPRFGDWDGAVAALCQELVRTNRHAAAHRLSA
jgi:tetratricopeptide (TPR) repeat protein